MYFFSIFKVGIVENSNIPSKEWVHKKENSLCANLANLQKKNLRAQGTLMWCVNHYGHHCKLWFMEKIYAMNHWLLLFLSYMARRHHQIKMHTVGQNMKKKSEIFSNGVGFVSVENLFASNYIFPFFGPLWNDQFTMPIHFGLYYNHSIFSKILQKVHFLEIIWIKR